MKKIAVIKQAEPGNDYFLTMWLKSLDFWNFPYELIGFDTFHKAASQEYDLVLITGIDEVDKDTAGKLEEYLESGGKLIVCGSLPGAVSKHFGYIKVRKVKRSTVHRCIKINSERDFYNWKKNEILFFTNTFNCSGNDYVIDAAASIRGDILAFSQEMSIMNQGTQEWGDWHSASAPAIIETRAGKGAVMYIPIPIGAMEWVEQATVPYFTAYPYVLKNNGILLLMRNILQHLLGPQNTAFKALWPNNARCVACISGDVHDYPGIEGREDREYEDMLYNFNLLKAYGLEGKATYYVCGAVAKKHPEAIKEGLERGYELCPHTYQETQYSQEQWNYSSQRADVERCIEAFREACPENRAYTHGFRTHGYQSDHITRQALDDLGYEYISDMQSWEFTGKYNSSRPGDLVTYVAYPQNAVDGKGRPLDLLEIPDSFPNDHVAYRLKGWSPEEALEFWKYEFDRIYRLEGMFQTCWHPYISLKEGKGRENTYRKMIEYMKRHDGVEFMTIGELSRWWRKRSGGGI